MQTSFLKTLALGAVLASPMALAATGSQLSLTDGIQPKDACSSRDARKSAKCVKAHAKKKVYETFKGNPVDTKLPETARVDATAGVFI